MRPSIFISTPLEECQVQRIRDAAGSRATVIHEPDLLPPTRYAADHKGEADFSRSPEQSARWQACLAEADFLWDIPPLGSLPDAGIAGMSKLRWIQTTSSGIGKLIERAGLTTSDVVVTTAKGVHAGPLSEFAMLAILMHFKRLRHLRSEQAAHRWERYCGDGLPGKTVAILGAGEVGHRVAEICKCMGMRVLAMSRRLTADQGRARGYDGVFHQDQLASVLGDADAVVLCLPHTSQTEGMLNSQMIAAMKSSAVLVNIARGQIVDEAALIDALKNDRLGFAALDVAQTEPLPAQSALWDLPNVLISPHSASTVADENRKVTNIFIHNLECFLAGRLDDLKNVFDKSGLA